MKPDAARKILALHVHDSASSPSHAVEKALKALEKAPGFEEEFQRQIDTDARIQSSLRDTPIPESTIERLGSELSLIHSKGFSLKDPAFLSVVIGIALLAFVLCWNFYLRPAGFPPEAIEMANVIAGPESKDISMEQLSIPIEELGDRLVLKGFEGFRTPRFLIGLRTDAAALSEYDDKPLAIASLPEISSLLIIFNPSEIAIPLPSSGDLRMANIDQATTAVLGNEDGMGWLLVVHGDETKARSITKRLTR